ncbi:uncharacterized protein LOC109799511 [Cajanus cajan]|uniref:uncharacterized protein LOC109799511 n=1 Tax=Cajanus cajan TaxID=3821 RepID=UPI00098D82DF|nr:uncharacterized protein LOC109799511 [Cajanus cajan]
MRIAQSRQKSYADRRRKDLEFQEGDHLFLKVIPWTGVGRSLKSKKHTPRFICPFQILKRVGSVAYQIALPPKLSNLHDVFHISQLRKYIHDPSHVIESDHLEVKENLTVEATPVRVEDRMVKQLRGKEIPLVKVIWGGATPESAISELEEKMKTLRYEYSFSKPFPHDFVVYQIERCCPKDVGQEVCRDTSSAGGQKDRWVTRIVVLPLPYLS